MKSFGFESIHLNYIHSHVTWCFHWFHRDSTLFQIQPFKSHNDKICQFPLCQKNLQFPLCQVPPTSQYREISNNFICKYKLNSNQWKLSLLVSSCTACQKKQKLHEKKNVKRNWVLLKMAKIGHLQNCLQIIFDECTLKFFNKMHSIEVKYRTEKIKKLLVFVHIFWAFAEKSCHEKCYVCFGSERVHRHSKPRNFATICKKVVSQKWVFRINFETKL